MVDINSVRDNREECAADTQMINQHWNRVRIGDDSRESFNLRLHLTLNSRL